MAGKAIIVVNEKGGVGKTTTSVQIAFELSERGFKVCLVDNDPSGDASKALFGTAIPDCIALANTPEGKSNTLKMYLQDVEFDPVKIEDNENLYFMGAGDKDALAQVENDLNTAFRFENNIEEMLEVFDYVIIDCPPSFGIQFTAAILSAEKGGVLIPYVPEELSFSAACKMDARITEMNKKMRREIKIIGFMANNYEVNPLSISTKYYLEQMLEQHGELVFKAHRHRATPVRDAIALQESLSKHAKKGSKAMNQLVDVVDEFLVRVE